MQIHDSSSLQQAQITKFMESMFNGNDRRQSFKSLANSTIDYFLPHHHPATVQISKWISDDLSAPEEHPKLHNPRD